MWPQLAEKVKKGDGPRECHSGAPVVGKPIFLLVALGIVSIILGNVIRAKKCDQMLIV